MQGGKGNCKPGQAGLSSPFQLRLAAQPITQRERRLDVIVFRAGHLGGRLHNLKQPFSIYKKL